ncbi:MAG: hypothetical protein K2I22_09835 [Lachnospiraceae bacterium]|nr:hypothetical protein [Lachnospiraceae bacterium]
MKRKSVIKRNVIVFLLISLLFGLEACGGTNTSEKNSSTVTESHVLVNKMSDAEFASVKQTEFQLLDAPWAEEKYGNLPEAPVDGFYDDIIYGFKTKEELIKEAEEEQKEGVDTASLLREYHALPDGYKKICGVIVEGRFYFSFFPEVDYDGSKGETYALFYNADTNEQRIDHLEFADFDEFKEVLRKDIDDRLKDGLIDEEHADTTYNDIIALYKAVIAEKAIGISSDAFEQCLDFYYEHAGELMVLEDAAYAWEMDKTAVEAIADHVKEYHFFDDELHMGFAVHVVTPPDYDSAKAYPALVLTDAVWRFNDVAKLWTEMENGKANPYVMITVGFEYDMDSWSNDNRAEIFCRNKKEFLDFLTDNMMPYLADEYSLDFEESVLFGHSQGGVFAHYAAFNSDLYENQPFGKYIIGSPTFWTPYFTDQPDFDAYKNDYGYFERRSTMNKELYLTGGDDEDKDYEEYYGVNDSTLEGLLHLKERLDSHGITSYFYKIYDSNHYMYIPEMLIDFTEEKLIPNSSDADMS